MPWADLDRGTVDEPIRTPELRYPTTLAVDGSEIIVVNSRLDMADQQSDAVLPFTLSRFGVQ